MCLACSMNIKEASVLPVVRVTVRVVENEFEGAARVRSHGAMVMTLDFSISVMEANEELKTEE